MSGYVIRVGGGPCNLWLTQESDEDDGQTPVAPPTTSELAEGAQFPVFNEARAAIRAACKQYPNHQFMLDTKAVSPFVRHGE